jgi:hypothetical protein
MSMAALARQCYEQPQVDGNGRRDVFALREKGAMRRPPQSFE